jgi:hypothetical protein
MQAIDLDARIKSCRRQAGRRRRADRLDRRHRRQSGPARSCRTIDQKKARTPSSLSASEPRRRYLADLKMEGGRVRARAAITESEAMPVPYAAELLGIGHRRRFGG